ncbi:beta-1,3-xylanase precursor [mine drainage metagenome]|uniref:Beta-1,3-xylanase n=1 Tax=mine drainage metagenome TaxID=410659 RepID=A0A1J5R292_9ZZZZ
MKLTHLASLVAAVATSLIVHASPAPREYLGARLEPHHRILTGAGQVEPSDFIAFCHALDDKVRPRIFMDYVDVHDDHIEDFFAKLAVKQREIPWPTIPQIGLGFDYPDGSPYDGKVAAGYYDAHLRTLALCLKRYGKPVFLRIGYEFHGTWNGYTPRSYIQAYRRVVDVLRKEHADNVATIWCAEAGALPADYMKFYPGDDYVDWWGIDLFIATDFEKPNPRAFMQNAERHHKPVMIGESTARKVTTLRGLKSWTEWFVPYFRFIDEHPNVKAFCYINWDWDKYSKLYGNDWWGWGDCRVVKGSVVATRLEEELSNPIYAQADRP